MKFKENKLTATWETDLTIKERIKLIILLLSSGNFKISIFNAKLKFNK